MSDADDAFEKDVRENLLPKVAGSAFVMTLVPEEPDVKICLEMGAAVMFNKPVLLVSVGERTIPEKLRKIADEVVVVDMMDTDDARRSIQAAIGRMVGREIK